MLIQKIKDYLGSYWLLKIALLPIFIILSTFYIPYLYIFYSRNIKKIPASHQLFFQAHDDYGAILELLNYIRCWNELRNTATLIIFTPKSGLVIRLAKQICPSVKIIAPRALLANLVQKSIGIFLKRMVYPPLYYHFKRKYSQAINIYGIDYGRNMSYVKHLDDIYKNRPCDNQFWDAYAKHREILDLRYDVVQDYYKLSKHASGLVPDELALRQIVEKLKISGNYILLNINTKDYLNPIQNSRRIINYDRYNILIDYLIAKGYFIVLQGTEEQPKFEARKGFVDYAHSIFQSPENDLLLYGGCTFCITSKSGIEWYALLCDKPLLGLNYTELTVMQPNIRCRYFPKHIKNESGNIINWREYLTNPVFFQLGRMMPTEELIEFVEMEDYEIIAALNEFIPLLSRKREQWLDYSELQNEFKQNVHPCHLDLYLICGVPCDAYLNKQIT